MDGSKLDVGSIVRTAPEVVKREEVATSKASNVVLSELFLIVIDPVVRAMSSLKVKEIVLSMGTAPSSSLGSLDTRVSPVALAKLAPPTCKPKTAIDATRS